MEFFQQLAAIGNIDMTIRIMQKNDTFTINVMPGSGQSHTRPVIVSGTATQLDESFIKAIVPGVQEIGSIVSTLEDAKKDAQKKVEDKKADKTKAAEVKQKPAAKAAAKSKKKQRPEPVEGSLFEGDPAKENEEVNDSVEAGYNNDDDE